MTTETILTNQEISDIWSTTIEEWGLTFQQFEQVLQFARAIEQTVLQSAEIQSLRKDAARYRWLRDMIENQDLVIAKVGSWSLESWSGDDPDHYIDAAMEQRYE